MNPAEWLARSSHLYPDASALLQGEDVVADYTALATRAASIAASGFLVHLHFLAVTMNQKSFVS